MEELNRLVAKGTIPCPNVTLYGRGMQLIYSISGGADGACSDLSRVFRLPHSVHSKTGKQIEVAIWTKREYQLTELYEYVPPMEKKRPTKRKGIIETLPAPKGVMTLYSLNTARKVDLEKIVEMRRGNIEHRNDMTYIYAFTTALIVKQQHATVEMAIQLNDRFTDPQPHKEVRRTATRAYKDAITFFDALADNKFKMDKLPKGLIKPMKNVTVLEKLNINLTQDEKEHMSTLLDKAENQRRDTIRKRAKRGSVTREKYIEQKQEKKQDKLRQLKTVMETNPKASQRQLARILGISESYVRKLKTQL